MRRATREEDQDNSGYDSFLDIIANLVGILIILVVVVGAQVSSQWIQVTGPMPEEVASEIAELETALRDEHQKANRIEIDNAQLGLLARQEEAMSTLAEAERDRLQHMVVLAEREVESRIAELDNDSQKAVMLQSQLASFSQEADEIESELKLLQSQDEPPNQLEHHATPIAQTVFNDEVHFRLKSGHLAYVPMDELVNEMTSQLRFNAEKLRSASETIEVVGPIDQFRMQYILRLKEQLFQTELGVIRKETPEFVGFVLLPAREILGESVSNAISDSRSDFQSRLEGLSPERTTVTVWVYPDSYDEYLNLESWLHDQNFLVASWPLPANQPIAGGPNGYRSVAQ